MTQIEALRGTEHDSSLVDPNVVMWGFTDHDPYVGLWSATDLCGLFEELEHISCGNVLPSDLKFMASEGPLDFNQQDWDEAVRHHMADCLQIDLERN